jgi:hypothetical protein
MKNTSNLKTELKGKSFDAILLVHKKSLPDGIHAVYTLSIKR